MSKKPFISGSYKNRPGHATFSPTPINHPYAWDDPQIDVLLEEATRYLGELNAFSTLVPDVDFFIQMHVIKEATTSSHIEGTQTGIDEVVLPKKEIAPDRRDDWVEVQNYIRALNRAIRELKDLPVSMRLLRRAHGILMKGVRGHHKQPGEIRRSQNWIGGSSIKEAFFIPPHHSELPGLLSDLEKYLHNERLRIPSLVRAAVAHYQFETIHPFLDGNGRIGRLLIILYLVDRELLLKPTLYLSDYFDRHRARYYDSLTLVRANHDLEQWIRFFLMGVSETAKRSKESFAKIVSLKEKSEKKILALGRRASQAQNLLYHLFSHPIVRASQVEKFLKVTPPTASSLLSRLESLGVVREITGFKRNRVFEFSSYMDIFRK